MAKHMLNDIIAFLLLFTCLNADHDVQLAWC